jgi:hypothetical protein
MWGFYWRIVRRTPRLLLRALRELDTWIGMLTLVFAAVGLGAWRDLLPWWAPYAAFGVLLLYGFLRENYETYLAVEGERNILKKEAESNEERAAIGQDLQRLYSEGANLRAQIMCSTDDSAPDVWNERLVEWRQRVIDYLAENASTGKAQYVDGVTSVSAATISGMKSSATRREKETIVLHLQERLKRLADVMKEY